MAIRRVSRGAIPLFKSERCAKDFQGNQAFDAKAKENFSANQRHCLRNLLHQPLVEPDQSAMFYQLSMIKIKRCVHGGRKILSRVAKAAFSSKGG